MLYKSYRYLGLSLAILTGNCDASLALTAAECKLKCTEKACAQSPSFTQSCVQYCSKYIDKCKAVHDTRIEHQKAVANAQENLSTAENSHRDMIVQIRPHLDEKLKKLEILQKHYDVLNEETEDHRTDVAAESHRQELLKEFRFVKIEKEKLEGEIKKFRKKLRESENNIEKNKNRIDALHTQIKKDPRKIIIN